MASDALGVGAFVEGTLIFVGTEVGYSEIERDGERVDTEGVGSGTEGRAVGEAVGASVGAFHHQLGA